VRLSPGARLGPYEILVGLGAGGMGEVYKARDTRLDRSVAIKILPSTTSADPDARLRFEREARTISQLSHPHICALYDVGEAANPDATIPNPGTVQYLVMELLEGDTLATRLEKGALPPELMLRYAIEIADALDKAHRAGIVHRDLKPANVMLTRQGVKLLDFGLAKAAEPFVSGSPSLLDTAPVAPQLSAVGTTTGTLQYMAPEQVEGRLADTRSDIFAFGVVVFEMATGRKAFSGSGVAVASAILHDAPPAIASLNPSMPAALDRTVRTCLAKDPDERWQSAHDVRLQLRAMVDSPSGDGVPAAPSTTAAASRVRERASARWLPWAIAAAATVTATIAFMRPAQMPASTPTVARFLVLPPPGGAFFNSYEEVGLAMAPDGSQVAFTAVDADGKLRLWLRPIAALDAKPVTGTDDAMAPFWSPDSRAIAFFTSSKLRRFDLNGGVPVTICDVREGIGFYGTWGSQGQILFSSIEGEAIYAVPANGGTPAIVMKPDPARAESRLNWPSFLPDGRRFLYLSRRQDASGHLMVGDPGRPPQDVRPLQSGAQFVDPGYLVFASEGTLVGQRFDPTRAEVLGEPFSIADPLSYFFSTTVARFSAGRSGALAYQFHGNEQRLLWFDRSGRDIGTLGEPGEYQRPRVSPDGRRVAFDRLLNGAFDVWAADLDRSVETRLTFGASSEGTGPWAADGRSLFFNADRGAPPEIFRKNLVTGAEEKVVKSNRTFQEPEDLSPDGRTLLFMERAPGGSKIWMFPLDGSGPPSTIVDAPFEALGSRFSPDGRSFSYASSESGRSEVYVSPFPPAGEKIRVSTSGVRTSARWNRRGSEFFYVSSTGQLMAVPAQTSPTLRVGTPVSLFQMPPKRFWTGFDVSPDGRFIAIVPQARAGEQPVAVVTNWIADMDRRAPR
jgi:Tol biopolymer transport system component